MRKINEECGVFGMIDAKKQPCVHIAATALLALQHRGQEGAGIAYFTDSDSGAGIACRKNVGLVSEVFDNDFLASAPMTTTACGHVRYSTTGGNTAENTQPIVTHHSRLTFAVCHNGNITNADALRSNMVNERGAVFYTTNDTEIISKIIIDRIIKTGSLEQSVVDLLGTIEGAYSLIIMTRDKLIVARDPNGFRPLCIGKLGTSTVAASETCAFDSIGATYVRDVKPGEICCFTRSGESKSYYVKPKKRSLCVFELIYFARPDSFIDGMSVYKARLEMGRELARQCPTDADIVCGVPESGFDAAYGYSMESGVPYGMAFVRNRYVGRSFILPTQKGRARAVGLKLNPLRASIEGKRVILVDDSIVRGTTSARIIKSLRDAGAKEIHMRISAPPFIAPCYFGTDIDSKENLIANKYSIEEIREKIGADSLVYLDVNRLISIKQGTDIEYCTGCFTDKYPIDVSGAGKKDKFD